MRVEDVTSRWACAGLWGPKARDVLAAACTDDLSFGYMRWGELAVGDVPVRALRVTYVGELGWELYCPMEYGSALWRTLWEAGQPHGLVAGGYRAIDSLRLEKGYRVWGADITPDDTPYEGGVGFCVRADKEFLGTDALDDAPARRAVLPHAGRSARRSRSPTSRSAPAARSSAASRAAATATPSRARSPTPTSRPSTPRRAPRSRSRSSANGSTARSRTSRCSIPEGLTGPLVTS